MKNNPYIGPRPFQRGEQRNFHGRAREARDLLALIKAERVVLFYAQSGAGKTSLLNAQVIPSLEEQGFQILPVARVGSDLPPGIAPERVGNIFVLSALMGLAGEQVLAETLLHHTLTSFLRERYAQAAEEISPPILILDQFEEILTTHRDRWQDAQGFFEQLRDALREIPELGCVLAMREDHVAGLEPYAALLPKRLRTRFRMERLGREGALEAIQKPALQAGSPFDVGVAERLVDDLSRVRVHRGDGTEASLPGPHVEPVQLQVVCQRLWENLPDQSDLLIQWEEVEQFGNIDRALIDFYANALKACQAQDPSGLREPRLRRWFGEQLITPLKTRGLALRGTNETAGLPNTAVDILESRHIIRADARAGARWYELVHDRLVDPIVQSNREWEAARQTPLRLAAQRWKESNEAGLLYRDQALADALAWIKANPDESEPCEAEFLAASVHAEKQRARSRRLVAFGGLAALLIVIVMVIVALRAVEASQAARSRELAAVAMRWRPLNQEQSILLARMAVEEKDTVEAQTAFRQAVVDFYPSINLPKVMTDVITSLAYSPPGRSPRLAGGTVSGQIYLWDAQTRQWVATLGQLVPGDKVWQVVYSPAESGRWIASANENRTISIWDAFTGQLSRSWEGGSGPIYSIDYSRDGRWLASGGSDPAVKLWNPSTGQLVKTLPGHTADINSVAFSPDGQWLAAGSSDMTARLWRVTTTPGGDLELREALTLTGHTLEIIYVAFSPDSQWLATASWDKTIRLWDVNTGREVETFVGHTDAVWCLAFSPDGHYLISSSRDSTVRIWDMARRDTAAAAVLTGHVGSVDTVAISPAGDSFASSASQNVRLWTSLPLDQRASITLRGHSEAVRDVVYNPNGQFLASGAADGTARIWDMTTGENVMTMTADSIIWSLTYSRDGRYLVTCSDDANARIWDTSTGELVRTIAGYKTSEDADFSPDGRFLALAWGDGTATVYDTTMWTPVQRLVGHTLSVYFVLYSPDGRTLATGSIDRDVRLWDVVTTTGTLVTSTAKAILSGHTHDVYGMSFSPDGRYLATGSRDKTVRIWDMRVLTTTYTLIGHSSFVYGVAYSPDGRTLATSSADQTVRIWDMTQPPPKTVAIMTGHSGRVTGVAYSPDGKYIASCSDDNTVRRYLARFSDVWNLARQYVPRELTADERLMLLGEK